MTFKYLYLAVLNVTCVIEVERSFILTQKFFVQTQKLLFLCSKNRRVEDDQVTSYAHALKLI